MNKISIIVPYFSGFGSNESELAEEFTKLGYDVNIVTTNVKKGSRLANITLNSKVNYKVNYVDVFYNVKGFPITKNFKQFIINSDLVLIQEDYQYMSYLAYKYCKKLNIKYIVSNERYVLPKFPRNLYLKFVEFLFSNKIRKNSKLYTTHSLAAKNYLIKNDFKNNITVIPTPVNINKIQHLIKTDNIFKNKFGFNKKDFVILTIGRLVDNKNYFNLINSFKKLPSNYKLVIIGNGFYKDKFLNLIKSENLSNIFLITDFIKHEDIINYINSADIYIQPSFNEPFGIAVREAMCCKKPIIVSNVGGLPDAINNNGCFIDLNCSNLKVCIDKCIGNYSLYSKNSFELIKKGDVKLVAKKYLEI